MKTLLHQQLAKAGEQARKLRLPPEAPLRLPAPLTEFQPFVNKVWSKAQTNRRTPALTA
jgi:hypothetical protein